MNRLLLLLPLLLIGLLPSYSQTELTTKTAYFNALRARHLGPAVMSGRVSSLAVHPDDPSTVYIGSASGGVWKTVSGGSFMRPIFDDHTQSIGKVAISPSQPETIYVGTGEPWTRNSISVGTGLYKSTNGGTSWTSIGLENSERIADIIVHPNDPNTVYVAALGHLWDDHEERGVFKTTDGGQSWTKILYVDETTGATDLDIDPENPEIVYAVLWSHRRYPWSFDSGFKGGSGVYKSTNGGQDWFPIQTGLPNEKLGRMAIGVAPSNGDVIYLSVECETDQKKGLYLSTDAGSNWEMVSNEFNTKVRPFYFSNLTVDPSNDSIVAKCGLNAILSEDRGRSFTPSDFTVHSDVHDIWIDPANGKHIILATDGGIYESLDRGRSYQMWMNLPLAQFYRVSVDNDKPFNVYGGLQDNGSWMAPSRKAGGVGNADWKAIFGGDGFYTFRHPTQENIYFAEYQGGNLVRYDNNTGVAKSIAPYRQKGEEDLRYNWNTPVHLSPSDPNRMYFASQYLYRSTNMGDTWERISPDLTTDDDSKQQQHLSGGLSIDNSTAENHCTIYAIAESPVDGNTVWVGTDDGNLQVTNDGGKTWSNVTANINGLPANTWVTDVEASPHDAATAYVTFDGHRTGDMTSYLYKTTDNGKSWTALATADISGYALSVRQDLKKPELLYLGTEFGLHISLDSGNSWARFSNNIPKVGIRDMVIQPRDNALVLGTHGRGIMIIDDLSPLQQLSSSMLEQKITFLDTPPTLLRDPGSGTSWFGGAGNYTARNPSSAAQVIYFNQKRHTFGKMYIEIHKDGEKIREIPAGKSAGLNIVSMPTRLSQPRAAPTSNRMALFSSIFGPNLPAGEYEIHLIKGKETFKSTFTLTYDPDAPYTDAERMEQQKLVGDLYDMSEKMAYLWHAYTQISDQLEATEGLKRKPQAKVDEVLTRMRSTMGTLVSQEGDGYVNETEYLCEDIANLYRNVSGYPGHPSTSQMIEGDRLRAEMATATADFEAYTSTELVAINTILEKAGQTTISWDSEENFEASNPNRTSSGMGEQFFKTEAFYQFWWNMSLVR